VETVWRLPNISELAAEETAYAVSTSAKMNALSRGWRNDTKLLELYNFIQYGI
jgi:hypothetical protein